MAIYENGFRRFFSGTLLSRISGMGRDLAMAFAFGDHPSIAAFMVAFRLSNLFRRLLGEGPFQSVFIPHYEGLKVQDPSQATTFFRKLSSLLVILLLLITITSEIAITAAFHYLHLSEGNREILVLAGWMLPGLLFICLYGLNISLLNCHDSFFIPSFAPFVCNAIWIAGALLLKNTDPSAAMLVLAKLVVVGFAAQWLLTLPPTLKHVSASLKQWLSLSLSPEIKNLAKSFSYGIVGVGAVQINALIDSLFARAAHLSGPVYLWYSIRLEQLVLAIFGIACVSTIVPRLSRAIKSKDEQSAQEYFSLSFRRILAIMIPCSFALFVLGSSTVNLLFGRGHFSDLAVWETTLCLWAYSIGLIPSTLVILFSALFYAESDFKTPMKISVYSVVINIALNALFVFGMGLGAISTALATSLCAWINCGILFSLSRRHGWKMDTQRAISLCFASLVALTVALGIDHAFFKHSMFYLLSERDLFFPHRLLDQALQFGALFLSFGGSLWLYAKVMKNRDLIEAFDLFIPQRKRIAAE